MSVVTPLSLAHPSQSNRASDVVSRRRRRVLLIFGASLALAACGRKGPLELPPVETDALDEIEPQDGAPRDKVEEAVE